MGFDIAGLLDVWSDLPSSPDQAESRFAEFYADPVILNGSPLARADLVTRARVMHAALAEPVREVLTVAESGNTVAVAFRMSGRHVGPLPTPIGDYQPTGRTLTLRVIDILTVRDGLIAEIHMVADLLGALAAVDAVTWAAG